MLHMTNHWNISKWMMCLVIASGLQTGCSFSPDSQSESKEDTCGTLIESLGVSYRMFTGQCKGCHNVADQASYKGDLLTLRELSSVGVEVYVDQRIGQHAYHDETLNSLTAEEVKCLAKVISKMTDIYPN